MNRRKKVFNRVVNPLLLKYLTDPHCTLKYQSQNIPMKYLSYFKEITGSGNGMRVRYRFRGNSKLGMIDLNHSVIFMVQIHLLYIIDK